MRTTADFVAYHAAARPEAPALIVDGRTIAFAQFDRDRMKFSAALRELGLPPGAAVAIGAGDLYVHWLLVLAAERLGLATASLPGGDLAPMRKLRESVDLVIAEPGFAVSGARRLHALSADWLKQVFAREPADEPAPPPAGPEDPVRIVHGSGTTGVPKRFVLLRRMWEPRLAQLARQLEFTPQSRYLMTAPFNVLHPFSAAQACLRSGGTVVAIGSASPPALAQALAQYGITRVSLFPILLKQILDELPAGFVKPPSLTIQTIGAPASEALVERALERLAVGFRRGYGANEIAAAHVARTPGDGGFGTILPEVSIEIVDDDDRPVPLGTVGRIRLKTACMIDRYADDDEATRLQFKDGWFYPEDMGILNQRRQLKVVGRRNEALNIGGLKVSPSELEELVLRQVSIADAGVASLPNAEGVEEIYVAVSFARGDINAIGAQIARVLSYLAYGKAYVLRLPQIPRNPAGKIERGRLKEAIAAARARAAQ